MAKRVARAVSLGFVLALLIARAGHAGEQPAEDVRVFVIDSFWDDDSHGENVASIVRSNSLYSCDIVKLDVSDLSQAQFNKALRKVLLAVREHPDRRAVVNVSLGSDIPQKEEAALVRALVDEGAVIIAAAGNDGVEKKVYPAAYPGVVCVTAVSDGRVSSYANYGEHVDVACWGHLKSRARRFETEDGARTMHVHESGTSISAPRVTGLVARLLYLDPELEAAGAAKFIVDTARWLPRSWHLANGKLGSGEVDFHRVLYEKDWWYRLWVYTEWFSLIAIAVMVVVAGYKLEMTDLLSCAVLLPVIIIFVVVVRMGLVHYILPEAGGCLGRITSATIFLIISGVALYDVLREDASKGIILPRVSTRLRAIRRPLQPTGLEPLFALRDALQPVRANTGGAGTGTRRATIDGSFTDMKTIEGEQSDEERLAEQTLREICQTELLFAQLFRTMDMLHRDVTEEQHGDGEDGNEKEGDSQDT